MSMKTGFRSSSKSSTAGKTPQQTRSHGRHTFAGRQASGMVGHCRVLACPASALLRRPRVRWRRPAHRLTAPGTAAPPPPPPARIKPRGSRASPQLPRKWYISLLGFGVEFILSAHIMERFFASATVRVHCTVCDPGFKQCIDTIFTPKGSPTMHRHQLQSQRVHHQTNHVFCFTWGACAGAGAVRTCSDVMARCATAGPSFGAAATPVRGSSSRSAT